MKTFEEYTTVMSKELKNNWSAEYQINKAKGKKPYIKKNNIFIGVEENKSIPKDAIYLTPEKAEELNQIGKELNNLMKKQEDILKNN